MEQSPAFQLYAADFYMDTAGWTAEQIGIYFRLLMFEWVNGAIPYDIDVMARIAQIDREIFIKCFQATIEHKFYKTHRQGQVFLLNRRLEEVRQNQKAYREKQRMAGLKGLKIKKEMGIFPFLKTSNPCSDNQATVDFNLSEASTNPSTQNQALQSSSSIKIIINYYLECFRKKFQKEPVIYWGKDSKIIKNLLKVFSEDDLKRMIDKFFESRNRFILDSGYTIGVFQSVINKLNIGDRRSGLKEWAEEIIREEENE